MTPTRHGKTPLAHAHGCVAATEPRRSGSGRRYGSALALLLASALLTACKPPEETRITAIIGAVLIDASSAPPISRSVLVVAGSRIRSIGEQASTPVPAGSDKINGAGKFLIAAPVAIPSDLPRVRTLAEARAAVDGGATAAQGMILDTEEIDTALLNKWRDLRFVFVPSLRLASGEEQARASRNTKRLASAGVLIAAGDGEGAEQEWQLLEKAGLSPAEVLAAATRNAARAAQKADDLGSLTPGMTASCWLLRSNPLETAANLSRSNAERIMIAGEWTQ
jgi:hypothetical protein